MSERDRGATLIGVESDAGMLQIASNKGRQSQQSVCFASGSALALPFQSEAFDRVLITFVLHHLNTANKQRGLSEIFRVLRPAGHYISPIGAGRTLMRIAALSLRLFERATGTEANLHGRLPELCAGAGFVAVTQTIDMSTTFGTVTLLSATRPV